MPRINGTRFGDRLVPGSVSAGVFGPVTNTGDQIFTSHDVIYGAYGANLLSGGLGDDSYRLVSADGVIVEAANASGVGSDITGGAGGNVILGSLGRDTIQGGAGNDWLISGCGENVSSYDARSGWGNGNMFGYNPRAGLNVNKRSKLLRTNAVGPYAPVHVGGGNSYVFISQRPDLGAITIHGAVVQASNFLI